MLNCQLNNCVLQCLIYIPRNETHSKYAEGVNAELTERKVTLPTQDEMYNTEFKSVAEYTKEGIMYTNHYFDANSR